MEAKVSLREIEEPEYDNFIDAVYFSYAEERAVADHTSLEEAAHYSHKLEREDLPAGFSSPGNFFYYIYSGEEKVGALWLTLPTDHLRSKYVYISDLVIYGPYRRQGYATAALLEAERIGRKAGCVRVDLNVFARNSGAQALYKKLGYSFSTLQMNKKLID